MVSTMSIPVASICGKCLRMLSSTPNPITTNSFIQGKRSLFVIILIRLAHALWRLISRSRSQEGVWAGPFGMARRAAPVQIPMVLRWSVQAVSRRNWRLSRKGFWSCRVPMPMPSILLREAEWRMPRQRRFVSMDRSII